MTGSAPMHRTMDGLTIDYGYLCDLARANGWRVLLAGPLDDGRHALRVAEGDVVIAGVKFPIAECPLDSIAETVFSVLHEEGYV